MISYTDQPPSHGWMARSMLRLPLVSSTVQRRGTGFVVSWLHRISGVLIVCFLGFHLLTLQALRTPALYDAKMLFYGHPLLTALEWALAFPVMLHALNGGRLILFESFGFRRDDTLACWLIGLWLFSCALLGITMLGGGLTVAPLFFWPTALAAAAVPAWQGIRRIGPTAHALSWKLQRLSGLFLLVMVPAHLFFMHLHPAVSKDAATVLSRLQHPFIKAVDIALLTAAVYHAACGLTSVAGDYLAAGSLRRAITLAVAATSIIFAVLGIRILFAG